MKGLKILSINQKKTGIALIIIIINRPISSVTHCETKLRKHGLKERKSQLRNENYETELNRNPRTEKNENLMDDLNSRLEMMKELENWKTDQYKLSRLKNRGKKRL